MRILLVWDRMGDYHRARVEALRNLGHVVVSADMGASDGLYEWESSMLPYHYCLSQYPVDQPDLWHRLRMLLHIIRKERIEAIGLAGYGRLSYILLAILAKVFRLKVIFFAESWYPTSRYKERIKIFFLRHFTHALFVSGARAEDYFGNKLNLRSVLPLRIGYSTVANAHFASTERISRNLDEYPHLLIVARFAPEKNHDRIIQAFLDSEASEQYYLKMVGSGDLLATLRLKYGKSDRLRFASWVTYDELPSLYKQASALILGSTFEPWGLVVNEAMAAGLPVLLSTQCGCVPELLTAGNGIQFDAFDTDGIAKALNTWTHLSATQRVAMGLASQKLVSLFDVKNWAITFNELLKECLVKKL